MLQMWDQGQEQDDRGMTGSVWGQPVHIRFTKAKIEKALLGEPVPENRGIPALPKGSLSEGGDPAARGHTVSGLSMAWAKAGRKRWTLSQVSWTSIQCRASMKRALP